MGVLRETKDLFIFGRIEDDMEILEFHSSEEEEVVPDNRRKNGNKNRPKGVKFGNLLVDNPLMYKGNGGSRRNRRLENMKLLLSLAGKEDVSDVEWDIVGQPRLSAFACILTDMENMKIWNDFVNSSEDEQASILNGHVTRTTESSAKEKWEEIPDKRAAHPAYTAEQGYQRMDRKLRDLLKKSVPMGMMENLESNIVTFFNEWPDSVFISKLTSGYERLLVHALCQFLQLRSISFTDNGERITKIENQQPAFLPPTPLLTQYIQQRS